MNTIRSKAVLDFIYLFISCMICDLTYPLINAQNHANI